jgi:hypothetical protein
MRLSSGFGAFFTYSAGLITISLTAALPAQASIVCEPGTITNYSNRSLAACILAHNTNVQVSSPRAGRFNFPCLAKSYILFDEKGQFKQCQLAEEIELREGNSLRKCPAEYRVYVSELNNGMLSINCSAN